MYNSNLVAPNGIEFKFSTNGYSVSSDSGPYHPRGGSFWKLFNQQQIAFYMKCHAIWLHNTEKLRSSDHYRVGQTGESIVGDVSSYASSSIISDMVNDTELYLRPSATLFDEDLEKGHTTRGPYKDLSAVTWDQYVWYHTDEEYRKSVGALSNFPLVVNNSSNSNPYLGCLDKNRLLWEQFAKLLFPNSLPEFYQLGCIPKLNDGSPSALHVLGLVQTELEMDENRLLDYAIRLEYHKGNLNAEATAILKSKISTAADRVLMGRSHRISVMENAKNTRELALYHALNRNHKKRIELERTMTEANANNIEMRASEIIDLNNETVAIDTVIKNIGLMNGASNYI